MIVIILLSLYIGSFAQEADFTGRWRCISFVFEGQTYDAANINLEMIFDFYGNGAAEITLNGETGTAVWRVENGAPVAAGDEVVCVFCLAGDMLETTYDDVLMRFSREPGTAQGDQADATESDYVMGDQTTRPSDKPQKPAWTETTMNGDNEFIKNTQKAMELIGGSEFGYELVTSYIAIIEQSTYSGMRAYDILPTYQVGKATYNASATWYASTIVHDAYHSKLYFDSLEEYGFVDNDMWMGYIPEMMCLSVQIDFLKEIGAPRNEVDYAISLIDTNYWDVKDRWW